MSEPFTIQMPVEATIDLPSWDAEPVVEPWFESLSSADGFDEASAGQWLSNIASGVGGGAMTGLSVGGPWGALIGGLIGGGAGALQTALAGDQPPASGSSPPPAPVAEQPGTVHPPAIEQPISLLRPQSPPPSAPPTASVPATGDQTAALQQLVSLLPALIAALSRSGSGRESERGGQPAAKGAGEEIPAGVNVTSSSAGAESVPLWPQPPPAPHLMTQIPRVELNGFMIREPASGDRTVALLQQIASLLPALITALSRSEENRESQREDVGFPAAASDELPIPDARLAAYVTGAMTPSGESVRSADFPGHDAVNAQATIESTTPG